MIPWYWLIFALAFGGQITSIVEFIRHYNLTDEELDEINRIKAKAKADIAKVRAAL
jgi:hypothetical protein